jgi:hypothetical protein
VPLHRDYVIDTGWDPATEGELADINRDDLQFWPLFGHERELGDPSWRAGPRGRENERESLAAVAMRIPGSSGQRFR